MSTVLAIGIMAVGLLLARLVYKRGLAFATVALQIFLLAVSTLALWSVWQRQDSQAESQEQIEETQDRLKATQGQIDKERTARTRVQAEINRYVCQSNNRQDDLLADLLVISLPPPGEPPPRLSKRDQEALHVFQEKLAELQDRAPCKVIVAAFLEASDTDDLRAIRRIFREQDRERERAGEAARGP